MKRIFINATNHNLTEEQKETAIRHFEVSEFINLPEEIALKFRSISFQDDINELVSELMNSILEKADKHEIYVHLPIGSPYFMACFIIAMKNTGTSVVNLVFSHSDRIVEEKDGKKISYFKFNGFQVINLGSGVMGNYNKIN